MALPREELVKEVDHMLQTNRYDPAILPRLEEFVTMQVTENFYDADTNFAILKIYQFHPSKYNAQIVSKILIKALMSIPTSDFLTCLYLIPESRQINEPIPVITQLARLLETGQFKNFWAASGACRGLLEGVPGCLDSFREFMLDVVGRTYRSLEIATLQDILDIAQEDAEKLIVGRGWAIAEGVVSVPPNEENQPRPPTMDEHLSFKQVASKML